MVKKCFSLALLLFLSFKLSAQVHFGDIKPAYQLKFANHLYSTFVFDSNGFAIDLNAAEFLHRYSQLYRRFQVDSTNILSRFIEASDISEEYYICSASEFTLVCFYSKRNYSSFHRNRINLLIKACENKPINLVFIAQEFQPYIIEHKRHGL